MGVSFSPSTFTIILSVTFVDVVAPVIDEKLVL